MPLTRWFKPWTFLLGAGLLLASVGVAHAMKEIFVRSKPHANVGTVAGQETLIWLHTEALVFVDGTAHGIVQLRIRGGATFLYRATAGWTDGTALYLVLERVGQDGKPGGATDLAVVRPNATVQDCLIYDFVGPNVHLEAPGNLTFVRGGRAR